MYNAVYGANLQGALAEFGNKVTVLTSKGSLDNLDKVAIGTAQIDFTKDDAQSMEAKAKILRENPGLVEYQKVVQSFLFLCLMYSLHSLHYIRKGDKDECSET